MARIVTLNGVKPKIGENCFLASTAVIIGDVEIADNCSIWYGAVLRGDVGKIRVGRGTNIQDNAVIHSSAGRSWVEIGEGTSIGHNAVVHGAIVGAHVLIGMNSVILDNAEIGDGAVVAASALVLAKTIVAPRALMAGVPAKFVKELTEEQSWQIAGANALGYSEYAKWFMSEETQEEEVERT
jgi:hexapeptide transferase family protein